MLKQTLALVGILLSVSVNGATISYRIDSNGNVTGTTSDRIYQGISSPTWILNDLANTISGGGGTRALNTHLFTVADITDLTWSGGGSAWVTVSQVPVPAAAWLFGSALIGLAGIKRKK